MMPLPPDQSSNLSRLREIIARLRAPNGCPWDREQTHASLRAALLEEAYETVAAIDAADHANLAEELGDLLLQIVFHSQLAAEEGRFDLDDVVNGIIAKLIRRHPHVFGNAQCADAAAVLQRWDEIKRGEKGNSPSFGLDQVGLGLPALMRAAKVQARAARVGFDWSEARPVLEKIREEVSEIEAAWSNTTRLEEEVGDLLFSIVNLARKLEIESELALTHATEKFARRFQRIERFAAERAMGLDKLSLAELEALWDEAKREERG